jgi:hypothetical protein
MELTGGARLAVTEGEGVVAGLRKREEESLLANTPMPRRPGWAERAHGLWEKRGRGRWLGGLRGRAGRLAAGPIGPNAKEKFFSE